MNPLNNLYGIEIIPSPLLPEGATLVRSGNQLMLIQQREDGSTEIIQIDQPNLKTTLKWPIPDQMIPGK